MCLCCAKISNLNIHSAVERLSIWHNVNIHKIKVDIFKVAVRVFVILLQALVATARGNDCEAFRRRAIHCLVFMSYLEHVALAFVVITIRILGENLAAHSVKFTQGQSLFVLYANLQKPEEKNHSLILVRSHPNESPFRIVFLLEVAKLSVKLAIHEGCVVLESNLATSDRLNTGRATVVYRFCFLLRC